MKKILIAISVSVLITALSQSALATFVQQKEGNEIHKGETGFPEIVTTAVKGAPKLGSPVLVRGTTKPVFTEKHGLAAPAIWDWNNDGKHDLLIGEFETGGEQEKGSAIRVYLNQGSSSDPVFSDQFEYARDTEGNVIEVSQW